ncbi:Mitochondrial intermembrane space import and assembly protein 40 [Penicillium subrubescens]|uniref:Mitochondrial intermembrane space import and assembly protein 40 n=1 Tax=Penicillium subrubescens TaxID=1316194 RepID=A0A1Q5T4Q4_9EURO|nr:Mitochondrial intermembrane space import and assembly protein 40 [Penicillium subrubescens]KAJ5906384.1 Mitochondrial intermembrane space import and assembly protein 40 [Penicillium subrubescens]OKO95203.1 Mitochondrial intermembrane space import and assembly protein 40 [Penicillium subrubescens]
MFRPVARALARAPAVAARSPASTRLISTAGPTSKSRSWKSTFARLGLAGGAIYYYNTSSAFAQEPSFSLLGQSKKEKTDDSSLPTLDSITPKIREEQAAARSQPKADAPAPEVAAPDAGAVEVNPQIGIDSEEPPESAAFNPETGEINWDCPCLGGMAHGPCGEEFRAAFSCFVYSNEEPKGIECIEKFKGMQDCFRQHPDVYGAELEDDEPEADASAPVPAAEGEAAMPADVQAQLAEGDSLTTKAHFEAEQQDKEAK